MVVVSDCGRPAWKRGALFVVFDRLNRNLKRRIQGREKGISILRNKFLCQWKQQIVFKVDMKVKILFEVLQLGQA